MPAKGYYRPAHDKQRKVGISASRPPDRQPLEQNQKQGPQIPKQVGITTVLTLKILLDHNSCFSCWIYYISYRLAKKAAISAISCSVKLSAELCMGGWFRSPDL
jgi:hypothetical protein